MSGGSYDYLYAKMRDGNAQAFVQHVDDMVVRMNELILQLQNGDGIVWKDAGVYVPYPTSEAAIIALSALAVRFLTLKQEIEKVNDEMAGLADMAHAIEWQASGDTGAEQTCDDAVAWLRARLAP